MSTEREEGVSDYRSPARLFIGLDRTLDQRQHGQSGQPGPTRAPEAGQSAALTAQGRPRPCFCCRGSGEQDFVKYILFMSDQGLTVGGQPGEPKAARARHG